VHRGNRAKNYRGLQRSGEIRSAKGIFFLFFLCVLCVLGGERFFIPPNLNRRTIFLIMIAQDLLDLVVCPACKKPLELKTEPEALKCGACRRVYPVRDGLPVLLIDEAVVDPS
jgi:uncharacterized protein